MAKRNDSKSKAGKKTEVVTKKADGTKKVTNVTLEDAKAVFDVAKDTKMKVTTGIRKDKQLLKNFDNREAKLLEQIERAKANTTKSAEDLVTKANEFKEETKKLAKEHEPLSKEAQAKRDRLEDLKIELAEIKAANRKKRDATRKSGKDGKPREVNVKVSKTALVKALARRAKDGFMVQYNSDGTGKGAVHRPTGVALVFGETGFTLTSGETSTEHKFGGGGIQIVEKAVRDAEKAAAKAAEADKAATG